MIKTMLIAVSIGGAALLLGSGRTAQADEEVGSTEQELVAARRTVVAGGGYRGGYAAGYGYRAVGGVGLW
jgi:hypothetical protein